MKEGGPQAIQHASEYERTLFGGCALVLVVSSLEFLKEITEAGLRYALYGQDGVTPDSISRIAVLGTIAAIQLAAIDTLPSD